MHASENGQTGRKAKETRAHTCTTNKHTSSSESCVISDAPWFVVHVCARVSFDSAAVPFSRRRAALSSPDAASESDLSTPLHPFNSNIYNTESQRAQRSGWWVRRAPRLLRGLP